MATAIGRATAMRAVPRSTRWPWTRALSSGTIAMLLPFTWVVQLDGCTDSVIGRDSGADLVRSLSLTGADAGLVVALLAIALATPWLARLVDGPRAREGVHVAGLFATSVLVARGVTLVLGTTEIRAVQFAGALALLLLFATFADAMVRVMLGGIEWWDGNHPRAPYD